MDQVQALSQNPLPDDPRPPLSRSETEAVEEWTDVRAVAQAQRAANARQLSGRRRFVDPTTCERDYSMDEVEFMHAMQDYKKSSGRMFPTWSEVLEVLTALGYRKLSSKSIDLTSSAKPSRAQAAKRA